MAVISPFLSRYAVDEVILAKNVEALRTFVLVVFGLFAFALVWKFFASLWQALIRQKFSVDLRRELFLSLQKAPLDIIGRLFKPGEIAYRYLADIDTLEGRIISFITQGLISLLHLLVVAFILIRIHLIMGLLAVGSIVAYLIVYWIFRERIFRISREVREFFEGAMGYITQYCSSLTEIRLLNGEKIETATVNRLLKRQIAINIKNLFLTNYSSAVIETLMTVWGLGLLGYGALLVIEGRLTLGTLIAFLTLSAQLFAPLNTILSLSLGFQPAIVSLNRIWEIFELAKQKPEGRKPEVRDEEWENNLLRSKDIEIRLEHLSFSHGNRALIDDVTCELKSEGKIYLVGSNGAGKSSLCKLIARIYAPSKGKIYLNNKDISKAPMDSLLKSIVLLTHTPYFFKASIWENLIYGMEKVPSEEQVAEALEKAGLHDFVSVLPSGLQSMILDQGQNLSTVQRLRLHCVRAFVRKPPVLILDEVLSGIEEEHREGLIEELAKDRTLIITATQLDPHKLNEGDRVYFLSKGRLSESSFPQ